MINPMNVPMGIDTDEGSNRDENEKEEISSLANINDEAEKEDDLYENIKKEAIVAVQEISDGTITGENVGKVLKAWKYSFEKEEEIIPIGEDLYLQKCQWVREVRNFMGVLNRVVNDNESTVSVASDDKLGKVFELVKEQNPEELGLLCEFLSYRVWYVYDTWDKTKPRWDGLPPHEIHVEAENALKVGVEMVTPILQESLPFLSQSPEGKASIRRVFEDLQASEQKEAADKLLLAENLDDDSRLAVAVQYINTYGFIPAIEVISQSANERDDIHVLYSRLEGNTVNEIMKELWEVYRRYEQTADFGDYYDNEITKKEISLVEKWSEIVAAIFGKDRGELYTASLAAGKGRMAIAMRDRGFKVVAIEPQEDFARAIETQSQGQGIRVVKKKWEDLTVEDLGNEVTQKDLQAQYADAEYLESVGGLEKAIRLKLIRKRNLIGIELGESTGRNLPHGNTPQKLLTALDTIRSISKDEAIWIVDFMDPYTGRYKKNIDSLRKNLLNLGVDPFQANFTFEGPREDLRFNRMTVSREQMEAYAELLGFKIREVVEDVIGVGEASFKNIYYVLEVDKDYYPGKFGRERLQELMSITGLRDPGVDLNEKVKSWDLSIGQALLFGFPETREFGSKLPKNVRFKRRGGFIEIEGTMTKGHMLKDL